MRGFPAHFGQESRVFGDFDRLEKVSVDDASERGNLQAVNRQQYRIDLNGGGGGES